MSTGARSSVASSGCSTAREARDAAWARRNGTSSLVLPVLLDGAFRMAC